jgi:signal transduction histidine kinase
MSYRLVWLAGLLLVAGLTRGLTLTVAIVLSAWLAFSALIAQAGWGDWPVVVVDLLFAVAAISVSGGLASPLWSGFLVAAWMAGRVRTSVVAVATGLTIAILISLPGAPSLVIGLEAAGGYAVSLLLAGSALGWLATRVRRERETLASGRPESIPPREAGRIYQVAAALSSSLAVEEVLDRGLDLGGSAIREGRAGEGELVSVALIAEGGGLKVAAARRMSPADRKRVLAVDRGTAARALSSGGPVLCTKREADPDLWALDGFRRCAAVLCLPLAADGAEGLLVFGHPRQDFFDEDRRDLLWAVAQHTGAALKNARLYQDLEREKARITELQEEARRTLARDLHDGPTQAIAAIAMRTNFVRRLMARSPEEAAEELQKVEELARRTTKEIRHMLFTMRPLILESQGLVAGLRQLADKVRDTHGENVNVEAEPDVAEGLDSERQGVIFYIAEEAINNARKHAAADHVWVRLGRRGDVFVLEVRDDGVGFNVGAVDADYAQRGSLGMVTMRERAALVGGTLRIESAEGQGTSITLTVPQQSPAA